MNERRGDLSPLLDKLQNKALYRYITNFMFVSKCIFSTILTLNVKESSLTSVQTGKGGGKK